MLLNVFDSVIGFIQQVGEYLGLDWIAVIALSCLVIALIASFLHTQFSLELRTARAVERVNLYLESNPFINEENLVEFNKLMKKIPSSMRSQWQQYMVNRKDGPSKYLSVENCIDKPLRTSSYKGVVARMRTIIISISLLTFVFCLGSIVNLALNLTQTILQGALISLGIYFIGEIYLLFLKSRRNSALADLYYNFDNFQKYIDRAVTTLPDYVDYEILFTRKEIVAGIPILQEYLQQRALYEQEQIKKAKSSQVEHEQYDFSALGINGSLVMAKSMRECEFYLGNRKRILVEVSELEGSRDLLEKSFDEKNKNNQRKLRDIQDSLERLKEKLDSTTNMIVGNDLRKQRENEIQKQRVLEKEIDEDSAKFESQKKQLLEDISKKKTEIEDYRKAAETSLNGEFKSYADKIFEQLKTETEGQVKEQLDSLKAEKQKLEQEIEDRDRCIVEKNTLYDEKLELVEQYSKQISEQEQVVNEAQAVKQEFDDAINERDLEIKTKDSEIFSIKKELESRNLEIAKKESEIEKQKEHIKSIKHKKEIEVFKYIDQSGIEFFFDEDGRPFYLDEGGQRNYKKLGKAAETDIKELDLDDSILNTTPNNTNDENLDLSDLEDDKFFDSKFQNINNDYSIEKELEAKDNVILQGENFNLDNVMPKFNKSLEDLKWKNSNALQLEEDENSIKDKSDNIENFDTLSSGEDLEDIDKKLEEQNINLEQKHRELAETLERTKALASRTGKKVIGSGKKQTNSKKKQQKVKAKTKKSDGQGAKVLNVKISNAAQNANSEKKLNKNDKNTVSKKASDLKKNNTAKPTAKKSTKGGAAAKKSAVSTKGKVKALDSGKSGTNKMASEKKTVIKGNMPKTSKKAEKSGVKASAKRSNNNTGKKQTKSNKATGSIAAKKVNKPAAAKKPTRPQGGEGGESNSTNGMVSLDQFNEQLKNILSNIDKK